MDSATSSGVNQVTAVDSPEVRSSPPGRLAAEDQGDDASRRVLVDPGELVDLDVDARFFPDLAPYAGLWGLFEFEHPAREFPSAVVGSPDCQELAVLADHHSGHGHGVQWR